MKALRILLAATLTFSAPHLIAQSPPPPPIDGVKKAVALRRLPFQGTVAAVDLRAKTFTFKTKDGKAHVHMLADYAVVEKATGHPATIQDVKIGDLVRGTRSKLDETHWEVTKLIIGPKKKPAAE